MEYVKEHTCKALNKINEICIEQFRDNNGDLRWYWKQGNELNQILYCPYCGLKLE